jgi:hypothetical protein
VGFHHISLNRTPSAFLLGPTHTDVSLWYVVQGKHLELIKFDQSEFNEVRWFPFREAPLLRCEPHLQRFLSKITDVRAQTVG